MDINNYIIDCTDLLDIEPKIRDFFKEIGNKLKLIRSYDKDISDIGIAGGFVLDTLLKLSPSDIDLKYAIRDKFGNFDTTCRCDYIKTLVNKTGLSKYEIDLGNIKENNNHIFSSVKDKHLGIFSHHPEYISQFTLDEDGRIWGNRDSLNDYINKVYNPRIEGLLAWVTHEGKSYHEALALFLIRGFGYIRKRELSMGDRFRYYLERAPEIFNIYSGEKHDQERIVKYFNKKVGSIENLSDMLVKHAIYNKEIILEPIANWLRVHN